jgi:sensor histidine kinase YesM
MPVKTLIFGSINAFFAINTITNYYYLLWILTNLIYLFICSLFNDAFSISRRYSVEWEDEDDSEQGIGKDVEESGCGLI